MNCGFGKKNKTQSFQKLFSGGYLFVFVEYLCKRSPKIKTKNIKNYSSILAIVNHRNWLDDSPPLNYWYRCSFILILILHFLFLTCLTVNRGGVKDTRQEAKETKKFRGQGQTLSRPRTTDTGASVLEKQVFKKFFQVISKNRSSKIFFRRKRSPKIFFSRDLHLRKIKKGLHKFPARFLALSNNISTVQKIVLSSSRGQGNFRGLEASRPRPKTRTSKCVLEAKDVLEDSTSDC